MKTPGSVKNRDGVAGSLIKTIYATLELIASTGVGTIPIFVVPTGEAYRVKAFRTVAVSAIGGSGNETAVVKLTESSGSADITASTDATFTRGTEVFGSAKTPSIISTSDVDKLVAAETLNVVTSGNTTGTTLHVTIDLERITNNI